MMTVKINATGAERKRLVNTISEWLGEQPHYNGAPTFSYEVGRFTVEKDGSLSFSELIDSEVVERLLEHIYDEGFDLDQSYHGEEDEEVCEKAVGDPTGISIQIPASEIDDATLVNLKAIVEAKGNLIKKAFGAEELPIVRMGNRFDFPWFRPYGDLHEVNAYMQFITALCKMARTQTRISAKEKEVDNEKYAFRCFLLRLGFIGEEYKESRKILMRNLSGSSAYKNTKEAN